MQRRTYCLAYIGLEVNASSESFTDNEFYHFHFHFQCLWTHIPLQSLKSAVCMITCDNQIMQRRPYTAPNSEPDQTFRNHLDDGFAGIHWQQEYNTIYTLFKCWFFIESFNELIIQTKVKLSHECSRCGWHPELNISIFPANLYRTIKVNTFPVDFGEYRIEFPEAANSDTYKIVAQVEWQVWQLQTTSWQSHCLFIVLEQHEHARFSIHRPYTTVLQCVSSSSDRHF